MIAGQDPGRALLLAKSLVDSKYLRAGSYCRCQEELHH
jgi:hypothetical protein